MLFDLSSMIEPVEGLEFLSSPFLPEEINATVQKMPPDKALGPDGFNGLFLQKCWPLIKYDFFILCSEFFHGQANLESINTSYITLVPKKDCPESVNDFRPISLMNISLKLLTKMLANKLQRVILNLVHQTNTGLSEPKQYRIA
jgi:hypothetical protein